MGEERISVIVPIYNVQQCIERCVLSIIGQTYKNLEILLIDDGSPDQCGQLCDMYKTWDERIHVVHKKNGGLSDARNVGLDLCTGDYVVFVDSDDWLDLDMIEVLYNTLKENQADIAECSYRNLYKDQVVEETNCSGQLILGDAIFALEAMLDWRYFKPNAWNKLYKRDVIGAIRYPKGRIHEDEFTTYKIMYNAKKLAYIDVSKYNYDRRRTDSITGEQFSEKNLDACEAFRERITFFEENGITTLEEKMNNVYCWQVLESAYKCYKQDIHGEKVDKLICQVRNDIEYLKCHKVDEHYIREFELLAKGVKYYGDKRDKRRSS